MISNEVGIGCLVGVVGKERGKLGAAKELGRFGGLEEEGSERCFP